MFDLVGRSCPNTSSLSTMLSPSTVIELVFASSHPRC